MTRYSIEPRTKTHVKGYQFLSFARNLSSKYKNLWWPIAAIGKKLSKLRKNFHDQEKHFRIEKTISKLRKMFRN